MRRAAGAGAPGGSGTGARGTYKAPRKADDAPCREALAAADRLGLHGKLYRVGGRASDLLLGETIAPGVVVMRFAKTLDAYEGLYQQMFRQHCLDHADLARLKFEQAPGHAQLRQTQSSYQPQAWLAQLRVAPV